MALVNGNDYDHIDLQAAAGGDVTRHMLKDAKAREDVSALKSTIETIGLYTISGMTFDQGGLRPNDAGDITSSALIRTPTNQVPDENFVRANCDSGYEFSVFAYDPTQSPKYIGVLQNDGTFAKQSSGTEIFYTQEFIPTTAQATNYWYRYVMRNKADPTVNITPTEGTHFHIYKNAISEITSDLAEIHDDIDDINSVTQYEDTVSLGTIADDRYIAASGNLIAYNGWSATQDFIPCDIYDYLIFTTSYSQARQWNAWYSQAEEGENSFISQFTINPGTTKTTPPQGAKYFRISSTDADMATVSVKGYYSVKGKIATLENEIDNYGEKADLANNYLTICTWNVGVFNKGGSKLPTEDVPAQLQLFRKTIGGINAHLLNVQEFVKYIDTSNTIASDNILNYKYVYSSDVSTRRIFSRFPLSNTQNVSFASGSGRGYTISEITVGGKTITIIDTHLSIEVNPSTYRDADITELISVMNGKTYVILTGDFNVYTDAEFDPFKTAGYTLCNGGDFGWFKTWPVNIEGSLWGTEHLDNIIVSSNIIPQMVETYETAMSDHAPLIATLHIN